MRLSKLIVVCLLVQVCQQADAQFGSIMNRIGNSAKQSMENAAVRGAEDAGRNALKSAKDKMKKSKKGE